MLKITDLRVRVEEKEIIKGLNLEVSDNEVVALMGPNGSGKSSLANTIIGNPKYQVLGGEIELDGKNILAMTPDERAKEGILIAFQYPASLPGITVREMLLVSLRLRGEKTSAVDLKNLIKSEAEKLHIDESLLNRSLNEGFSGGEKKKFEILQMVVLKPKLLILDEIDSGLDIDALEIIANKVTDQVKDRGMSVLVITHYQRLLKYLKPNRIVVLKDGVKVDEGGNELVEKLETNGYKIYE